MLTPTTDLIRQAAVFGPGKRIHRKPIRTRLSVSAAEVHTTTAAGRSLVAEYKKLAAGAALGNRDSALTMRGSGYALLLSKRAATRVFYTTGARGSYVSTPISTRVRRQSKWRAITTRWRGSRRIALRPGHAEKLEAQIQCSQASGA
jgi:hypothetical protein